MRNIGSIVLITLLLFSCNKIEKKEKRPPNILFILADDMGWADLPNYGNQFNEAPHIEALAKQGMQFSNAYAANPVCSPSRASIQTGQYPARIGLNDFLPGHWRSFEKLTVPSNKTQFLPLSYETIGEVLQSAGYKTGYFGKWHLGHTEKHHPKNQGYDESVVYNGGGFFDYNNLMSPKTDFPPGKILSEALTDLSIDFINKNKAQPFFLFLAHYDVHVQLDAQSELIDKYLKKPKPIDYPSNAIYAAMVENVDTSVGRILKTLSELDLEDDTVVVFFSDNGGLVTRYDKIPLIAKEKLHYYEKDTLQYIASSNKPLRAEKGTLFEGGIREPLIVKWPKKIKAASTSDALVSSIDFFPTFIELAKTNLPKNQLIDGQSIVNTLLNKENHTERTLYWHYPVYHHATPASAIRQGDWKLIYFYEDDHEELFNLKVDIGETNDVAKNHPEKKEDLLRSLKNWIKDTEALIPIQNPDFNPEKREVWTRHPNFDDMLKGTITTNTN
ncbi:sulfatase [Cellulophaga sp. Hel_I_12]|uniref:sulfatase n=1 Tax=Cellulophaga sp. Hel_I_12 TaxID=1249972 RepID=UPI00064924ED|nr:sulfatase [Cellulophaga sp. Hel_I_12]